MEMAVDGSPAVCSSQAVKRWRGWDVTACVNRGAGEAT